MEACLSTSGHHNMWREDEINIDQVKMDLIYTSCACNRSPLCVDWGQNNLGCYGACHAVVIFEPQKPSRVLSTIAGHSDRINSVHWIRRDKNGYENEILSCSTDKTARIWRATQDGNYSCVGVLSGHTNTVTVGRAVYVPDSTGEYGPNPETLIATASVDSALKIWHRPKDSDVVECLQTVPFGTGFVLDVSWVIVPSSNVPLLACGGDDQKIYLFIRQGSEFVPVLKLSGHEDWIRCLDLCVADNGDVLLASSSQDQFIRIWRISRRDDPASRGASASSEASEDELKMKENTFTLTHRDGSQDKTSCYAVTIESVLQGHEHWVYGIHWHPPLIKDGVREQPMCLLSSSMDKTMILWEVDVDSGVWYEKVRVGTVGGNTLGLYGAVFSADGETILAHGYQGAFHMWHKESDKTWQPGVTVGGHFDGVQEVTWDPDGGHFLLSVGLDQTTRLHGYWRAHDPTQSAWHELARPQVHGYDMTCITPIDRYSFASGADEKVIRVFHATKNFFTNFNSLCGVDISKDLKEKESSLPEGASVPALGLSNKAIFEGDKDQNLYSEGERQPSENQQYHEIYFSPLTLSQPPTEEDLLQNTLWPEVQKLYGHGYEIFTLACHPDGSVLASACKAANAEHAAVLLWDTSTWRQVGRLESNSLTVTQLSFSHSGHHLLAVSRDRTWALYKQRLPSQPQTDPVYVREAFTEKRNSLHTRIIWSCSWSHDDKYFITVSRDKKAVIWGRSSCEDGDSTLGHISPASTMLELADSITAVDFAPVLVKDNRYLVAFGLDNGQIVTYLWTDKELKTVDSWSHHRTLDNSQAHHRTVKRVRFRPCVGSPHMSTEGESQLLLASCSSDHCVKIHSIDLNNL